MATPAAQGSTFVSVTAWIFLVVGGLSLLIAVLQHVMLYTVFVDLLVPAEDGGGNDPGTFWLLQGLFGGLLVTSTLQVVACLGLLRRREWARRLFLVLLALGVLALLPIPFAQVVVMVAAPLQGLGGVFDAAAIAISVFTLLLTTGLLVAFVWIMYRLTRPSVRAEFVTVERSG